MEIPRNVRLFEGLKYAALALSCATLPFNERVPLVVQRFGAGWYVFAVFYVVLNIVIVWAIARKRQDWLRYLMAGLFLISLPFNLRDVVLGLDSTPVYWGTSLCTLALGAAAYYFVFTGDARDWFRRSASTTVS